MTTLAIKSAAILLMAAYAALRFKYELQMMQQNSYRPARYLRWLKSDAASSLRITDAILCAVLLLFWNNIWAIAGAGAVAILKSGKELGRKYKKPLVFTARAIRIYTISLLLLFGSIAASLLLAGIATAAVAAMAAAVLSPVAILLSVWILWPVEKAINRHYYNDAERILSQMPNLTVIGITGSYGKTSTKYYLHRILSERYNVLMTPGSFNTTLGVIRTIREQLKPYHDIFIVEMGAKQRGDVKQICDLVHPAIGIITAVGEQHLESFGSIENVQAAKFELIDSLPADGTAILNNDFEKIADRQVHNIGNVYRYSTSDKGDYRIAEIKYGKAASEFTICRPDGSQLRMETRLLGQANLSNLLAGYIAAHVLGMTDREIAYAVADVAQVEHRLSVKHTAAGITIIDDAFNSNPHGSKMALDTLSSFTDGKRIVITPGMIELGEKQQAYNTELGAYMTGRCDTAIIVGRYNRDAILQGLASTGFPPDSIITADTFAEATAEMQKIVRSGDVVLYENDLPDTFK